MTKYTITWAICRSTDVEADSEEEALLKLSQISNAVLVEDEAPEVLTCTTEADRDNDVRDELHWADVKFAAEVYERFAAMAVKEFGDPTSFEGVRPVDEQEPAGANNPGR